MQTQAFLKAVSSVGVFLLLAIPGFVFTRKKLLTGRQVGGISSVLVNFLGPAMVVDAMAKVQASRELLRQAGYANESCARCVAQLIRRFRESGEFPHEVGLFLSYPPEDVKGFIDHRANGFKCAGLGKVLPLNHI